MDETAIPKPIPSCYTMLSTVEPVPACSVDKSPTANVFTAVKIIDIQAPYHIKLSTAQISGGCCSIHAIETTEPAISIEEIKSIVL